MSCKYCRGEELFYIFEGEWFDGTAWREFDFNTKIIHGRYLGTSSHIEYASSGGTCCEIDYCPKCGASLGAGQ